MKLVSRASLAFKREKPAMKVAFGSNVITALTPPPSAKPNAKSLYADMPVPLSELLALNDGLSAAVAAALTGNHAAVASVKNAVVPWNIAFALTASFITGLAAGNEMIIREAGFVPTKGESQPAQKPGPVVDFKATINGSKGAIIAGAKTAVPEARFYLFSALPEEAVVSYNGNTMIITIGDKSVYISADTRKQTELYNLPSGMPYNISMFAINGAGSGPATTAQQVIPQ